jgi:hypothetical protein
MRIRFARRMITSTRRAGSASSATAVLAASLVAFLAGTACSSSSSAAPDHPTRAATAPAGVKSSAAAPKPAAGGGAQDACTLVSQATLATSLHVQFGTPKAQQGDLGGTTCMYQSAQGGLIIVQTSPDPDKYLPEAMLEQSYPPAKPLETDADRGFVSGPDEIGSGHVLLVKNNFGVDIAISSRSHYTFDQEQQLAAKVAEQL